MLFDNFFSSTKLLHQLHEQGVFACCTFRTNKKDLPPEVKVDEFSHGSFIYRLKKQVSVYQWWDTKNVCMTSKTKQRWKGSFLAEKSSMLHALYLSRTTSSVDRFDQKRNAYPVDRRSKWWHRIFYFPVDAANVNAFAQYTAQHGVDSVNLLLFKLRPGRQLIKRQTYVLQGMFPKKVRMTKWLNNYTKRSMA